MTMGSVTGDVEAAVLSLRRAASESSAWSDEQRTKFDRQRLSPLLQVGDQLVHALRRTDEMLLAARSGLRDVRQTSTWEGTPRGILG